MRYVASKHGHQSHYRFIHCLVLPLRACSANEFLCDTAVFSSAVGYLVERIDNRRRHIDAEIRIRREIYVAPGYERRRSTFDYRF